AGRRAKSAGRERALRGPFFFRCHPEPFASLRINSAKDLLLSLSKKQILRCAQDDNMTGLAVALLLGAASIHASWNYILKKSGGGIGFVWAFAALSALFYAPLAAAVSIYKGFTFPPLALGCIAASAVLHTAYYLLLDRGYRHGDLSVIYPLARATGPLLTIVVAISALGERPGPVALAGAALVVGGAFFLAASPSRLRRPGAMRGVGFALLTGCMIASYTIVDKQGVSAALIPPLVLDWGANLGRVIVMTPLAMR